MDLPNLSTRPQYLQLLTKQKQTLRDAKSRKGERYKQKKSRYETIQQFLLGLMMNINKPSDFFNVRTTFIPPAYPPCLSPFDELKKVMIRDLLLETHHSGNYLLLRSVTPLDRMSSIMTIVEDEKRDVLLLSIYNQEEDTERATEEVLPEGAILIVKEPYLKLMADGSHGIRIDHLSDVIYLPIFDERIPDDWQPRLVEHNVTVSDWKTKGNHYFNKSKYSAAIN